jgi:CRISPR-associated protein Cas1
MRLLNTLFVTTQGAYLHKEGETVAVKVEGKEQARFPIHNLGGIVCFGSITCSPFLMGFCAENQVGLSFLTEYGRFLARVSGKINGNVLLRRQQYRLADSDEACASLARMFAAAKIANARVILLRAARENEDQGACGSLDAAAIALLNFQRSLKVMNEVDSIRGVEGSAAVGYFDVFNHLILKQKNDFEMRGRNRRPPLDKVNALLSFIYTLLAHDVESALETVGLDPCVGFLHKDRPGRKSLALDLMEEFRPFLADRLVLTLINRQQIQAKDFEDHEQGAVYLKDEPRREVLKAWQSRKQEEIEHPFLEEKMPLGLLPFVQARLLARVVRGEMEAYPPFLWR